MREMRKLGKYERPAYPGLMGRQAILARVARGEIFDAKMFCEANLRGAAYDLRMASDMLVTPDGHRYGPREKCPESIVLRPGETAFVTTMEHVHLPWDVAANIAPKYHFARRGLLVFSGVIVDPGYGMALDAASCQWRPRSGERLHFLITNLSCEDQALRPAKDPIAALQFFQVESVPIRNRKEIEGAVARWATFEDTNASPIRSLGFFTGTAARQELKDLGMVVETINLTTDRVVVFGLYVLSAALLGIVATALVAILGNHRVVTLNLEGNVSSWYAYLFAVVAVALVLVIVLGPLHLVRDRRRAVRRAQARSN
jgi:deoxycytidine triphosphate deaminase